MDFEYEYYIFQAGDTLVSISEKTGVSVGGLVSLNPVLRGHPKYFEIGMKVKTKVTRVDKKASQENSQKGSSVQGGGQNNTATNGISCYTTDSFSFNTPEQPNQKHVVPKELIIVIDPGHGKIDPGTIYPNGSNNPTMTEKEIVRKLGKFLSEQLSTNPKYRIYSTRSLDHDAAVTDYDEDNTTGYDANWGKTAQRESLQDRVALANSKKADLFISLHVNSAGTESAHCGADCYISTDSLGKKSDNFVKSLENKLTNKGIPINSTGFCKLKDFYVLQHTSMPAVLLEIGYLSNINDRSNFQKDEFLKKLALGIKEAVDEFK